jgi:capsular exopolysaccharide synthesis family protein
MMRSTTNEYSGAVSLDALERIDFHQYLAVAKRRWKPAAGVFAATVVLAGSASSLQQPTYSASGKVLLRSNRLPALTGLGGEEVGRVSNLTMQSNPVRTEAENVVSRPVLQATIDKLKLKDSQGKPLNPEDLAARIKVRDVAAADVLRVSYDDSDPKRASDTVNQLLQEYVKSNILLNRSEAAAAREFITEQLPKTESNVRQADLALRAFKERYGVADLKNEQDLLTSTLTEIEKEMTQAKTQLSEADTQFSTLRQQLQMEAGQAITLAGLSQSTSVQDALSELQQLQSRLEQERSRYQEKHPAVQDLVEKEARLRNILQTRVQQAVGSQAVRDSDLVPNDLRQGLMRDYVNAEVRRLSLNSRLASLSNARDTYRRRVVQVPQLEQEQRELQRRLEAAQTTYQALLKRLQEVQLTEKQNMGTARIIEMAGTPDSAAGSRSNVMLLMGVALATLLSLGTVAFLEVRDKSIKSIKEARDLFGYTWLGTIPFFGKPPTRRSKTNEWVIPDLPVRDAPRSMVSASYRMLQANLKFLSLDKRLKSIVITSSVQKEGKSTIAANLAATMAQLGRRTLLIDTDLHHPSQHHIWNLTNEAGLSHVIVGQTEAREAVIPVLENLDVMTAGVIPPNPLALLDSKRIAALIESFKRQYDYVIIDAPPLVVEAEALTLGKVADGMLLVVRPGVVDFASAAMAKELLQQSSQNILGMVINSALLENEKQRSYYESDQYGQVPVVKPAY